MFIMRYMDINETLFGGVVLDGYVLAPKEMLNGVGSFFTD